MVNKQNIQLFIAVFFLFFTISADSVESPSRVGGKAVKHSNPPFSLIIPGDLKELSPSMRPKNTLYLFAKPEASFNKPSFTVNIKELRIKKDKPGKKLSARNSHHQNQGSGRKIHTVNLKEQVLAVEESNFIVNNNEVVRFSLIIPLRTQPIQITTSGPKSKKAQTLELLKGIIASFDSPDLIPDTLKPKDRKNE